MLVLDNVSVSYGAIEALRGMRIPVHDYLIVPRVAAVTLATMGCCFYFQVIAVIGGFALSSMMLDLTLEDQLHRFALHVSLPLMALELLKSLCFGFFIAAIACATGLNVPPRMTEVPRVPARAGCARGRARRMAGGGRPAGRAWPCSRTGPPSAPCS